MSHQPVVRLELGDAEPLPWKTVARFHHVHVLWRSALEIRYQVRIETELENRSATRVLGELGVGHLVRPAAEVARVFDPKQQVGAAMPAAPAQLCLDDDIYAVADRLKGSRCSRLPVHVPERDDPQSLSPQVF